MENVIKMITTKHDIRERSFDFALTTVKNCKRIKEHYKEFILTDQLVRSSTSVGANMKEARNAESKADFIHKLSICQKECDESIYWLELLMALLDEEKNNFYPFMMKQTNCLELLKRLVFGPKKIRIGGNVNPLNNS